VYTNARDLARFGLLYAQGGKWGDRQLISSPDPQIENPKM